MNRRTTCVYLAAAALGAWYIPDQSQAADDFYKDRLVELIVASDAANEYTRDGRLVARHLPKHLPGSPTIIVKNMVGASGITPANWLAAIAPRDGSTIMLLNKQMPMIEATKQPGVRFKSADFGWIGSMSRTNVVVITSAESGVRSISDAQSREISIGALGFSGAMATNPFALNRALDTKFKVIAGYKSSAEIMLAMQRGEVQGRGAYSWDFFKADHPDWREKRQFNVLVQIGLLKEPDLPDVPLLTDLARDEAQRAVFEFMSLDSAVARPFVLPPMVPDARLQTLRTAFSETMKDEEFLREAARQHSNVSPVSGPEAYAAVKKIVSMSDEVITGAAALMAPPR